jgi:pantothenate kinase
MSTSIGSSGRRQSSRFSLRRRPREQPSDVGFSFVTRYHESESARRAVLEDGQAVPGDAPAILAVTAEQGHIDHRDDAEDRQPGEDGDEGAPQGATIVPVIVDDVETLLTRARTLATRGRRAILGVAGPPGGGKSTLARLVADALGDAAVLIPMDGFHLAQAELVRLGRRGRMGAPDTFDARGYVALLERLRADGECVVYAPEFRRPLEEPIAGAIAVAPEVPLVVTEGNYLLLDDGDWAAVRPLLDEAWYVEMDEETRLRWLIQRHVDFGKTPDAARAWVMRSDQTNAAVVASTRERADVVARIALG